MGGKGIRLKAKYITSHSRQIFVKDIPYVQQCIYYSARIQRQFNRIVFFRRMLANILKYYSKSRLPSTYRYRQSWLHRSIDCNANITNRSDLQFPQIEGKKRMMLLVWGCSYGNIIRQRSCEAYSTNVQNDEDKMEILSIQKYLIWNKSCVHIPPSLIYSSLIQLLWNRLDVLVLLMCCVGWLDDADVVAAITSQIFVVFQQAAF